MPMRNDMQDYVYAFRPLEAVTVNISLCDSSFDTKLILFEEGTNSSELTLLSCNDDGCDTQSWLQVPTMWFAPFPVNPLRSLNLLSPKAQLAHKTLNLPSPSLPPSAGATTLSSFTPFSPLALQPLCLLIPQAPNPSSPELLRFEVCPACCTTQLNSVCYSLRLLLSVNWCRPDFDTAKHVCPSTWVLGIAF